MKENGGKGCARGRRWSMWNLEGWVGGGLVHKHLLGVGKREERSLHVRVPVWVFVGKAKGTLLQSKGRSTYACTHVHMRMSGGMVPVLQPRPPQHGCSSKGGGAALCKHHT